MSPKSSQKKNIELNANEFEKYTWPLIEKYFAQDKGKFIINHIISSYNDFVFKKIDDIIEGFNPIQIYNEYIPEKDLYKYQINLTVKNPKISKPLINEKDGTTKIMTPIEARQRNLCYSGSLYVDLYISVEYLELENGNEDSEDDEKKDYNVIYKHKTLKNINLGKIPIMVNSNYCILKNKDVLIDNKNECKYDHGGYFIINGNEKVIVSQDRIAENKTYVFKDNKVSAYSYIAEIRSVPENIFSPPKLTVLKLSSKTSQYGHYIRVVIHHIKFDIPLFILFRALGIESDKQILEYTLYDLEDSDNLNLAKKLKGCIEESNNCLYTYEALEYLSRYLTITGYPKEMLSNKNNKINIIKNILKDDFLPHVGSCLKKKALYLGFMVCKLLRCSLNMIPLDDRDSYINKRVDTPGIMMANLFRQYYGKVIRDMKVMIYKEIQSGSWKVNNNFINIINQSNIYKIMKSSIIESGYKYSLATGNWGIKNQLNKSKQGVAQVLNRLTYIATLSHLRRVNTPMEKNGKLIHPRKLHNTQWGIICPSETPEGGSIGLVKNLSMIATITVSSDSRNLREKLVKLDVKHFEDNVEYLKKLNKNTKIIINGDIIGYHLEPNYLFTKLKQFKRTGIINIYTSIAWLYQENQILINTESGRCIRPTYIIDNNKLRYDKNDVLNILNNDISFYDLFDIKKSIDGDNDNIYDKYSLKERSVIEFLDTEENNTTLVAINFKDLSKGFKGHTFPKKYQYLEIHPSLILGLCASNIPFPDHNQAPRNTYQSAMSKQAIGIYASNFRNRMDTLGNILNYPQVPLVRTKISDITKCNELPYGNNVIVAIATFTGFNQEDSIMINKSAVDRGFFNSTFYRTYKDQCNKNHSTGEEEVYCIPDPDNTKNMKPFNYDKLQKNGFVKENTYVQNNDIIIGKTMPSKINTDSKVYNFKDNSVSLKQNEYGFIDKNFSNNEYFKNVNNDGYKFSKIKIRNIRIPTIGDKLSSRHGQKGIIGMIYTQEEMPFTKDGIVPDIIINPHAIPSRMTIAQLLECIMGKACLSVGTRGNASAFIHKNKNEKKDDFAKILQDSGYDKHGNEVMYNPRTGEQINTNIFIGPTYYQRLKHMVSDKVHSRSANGPIILLTRQPAEGRAREGGLRMGEMETECMWAHGSQGFLKERFMECSDNYRLFVCKSCGSIANVNPSSNIALCKKCNNTTNFSQIRIPYACKLLFQEVQSLSINTKFLTQ